MDGVSALRVIFALMSVLAMIGLFALAARRFGLADLAANGRFGGLAAAGRKRLAVTETLAIDPRRRLLLIRRDDTEHLVLLTQDGAAVIEQGVKQNEGSDGDTPVETAKAPPSNVVRFKPPQRLLRLIEERL
ncbi:MAG: flagellar biosynthetic protein FliO [Pseudomonadota bacterium]